MDNKLLLQVEKLIKQDAISWESPYQKIVLWYHFVEGEVHHESQFFADDYILYFYNCPLRLIMPHHACSGDLPACIKLKLN